MKIPFKSLLPTLVTLCVGAGGVAICFVARATGIRWLYRVGFVVAFLASLFFLLYLWWSLFIGTRETQEERDPHAGDPQ